MRVVRAARSTSRRPAALLQACLCILLLAACGAGATGEGVSAGDGASSIVATTTILGDVAGEVAGDDATVSVVMPAGSDPHNFEPSARQLVQMQQADLIVANGGNLEETLGDALTQAEDAGVDVFRATDHIRTLAFAGGDDHQDEAHTDGSEDDHARAHRGRDPHFWLDPIRMASVARALGDRIGELTDDPAAAERRAGDHAARLEDLDGEIRETLADIPDDERTLVTNHAAFNYFADRYDFAVVGTVIPGVSTGAEPSAHDLERLAATIAEEQVAAIFTEHATSGRLAETLAREAGTDVQVVELYSDSLGEEGSEAATYTGMLRVNARRISDALAG